MNLRVIEFALCLGFVLMFSACIQPIQPDSTSPLAAPGGAPTSANAEILWDRWGVPHIFAQNTADAFRAYGWAQTHSHGNLLLQLYAQARGRGAEYYGESNLPTDQVVRLLGIPAIAEQWYAEQNPEFRSYLDAFAAGINEYAAAHPEALSAEAQAVLPVSGVDVIAHTSLVMATFVATSSDCVNYLPALVSSLPVASNGWAIGPDRSASGHALLLANAHLPWSSFATVYEAQIVTPEVDVYGQTLLGFPVPAIAFTKSVGWTHTVNTIDSCDAFRISLAGQTLDEGYMLDGAVQQFETITQTIQVRQESGELQAVPFTIRRTVHGPVVEFDGQFYAIRIAMLETSPIPGLNQQWWDMANAQNLQEFEEILARLQLPMFTVIYADHDGHIMALFNGLVPVRPEGDFDFWAQPVAGDDSALLWTETHPYSDLPKVNDPPSGWVQNANSAPWYMTYPPLNPDDYPAYLAPMTINTREQRSIQILMGEEQMTLDKLIAAKHSTYSLVAEQLLDDLIRAARTSNSDAARQAAEVLESWDREFEADSQGALLFHSWFQAYIQQSVAQAMATDPTFRTGIDVLVSDLLYATPFDPDALLETPRGLADEEMAVAALEAAVGQLQGLGVALDAPWGDIARLRRGQYDLPGNGNDGSLGLLRVIIYVPAPDGKLQSIAGDTYVAAVEFSDALQAQVVTTYGNASQPNAFDIGDQLQFAAAKQMHPAWRTRAEIEANLASRETLGPASSDAATE